MLTLSNITRFVFLDVIIVRGETVGFTSCVTLRQGYFLEKPSYVTFTKAVEASVLF